MTYENIAELTPIITIGVGLVLIIAGSVKYWIEKKRLEAQRQELERQRQDHFFQDEYTKAVTAEKKELVKFLKKLQDQV